MIRTKEYIIVQKHQNEWIPLKVFNNIEIYSLENAQKVLTGLIKDKYKIMEVCYCDFEQITQRCLKKGRNIL